jgi:hypothetical protein
MKRFVHSFYFPMVIIVFVVCIFFWSVFIKGYVPFPGDLLLTQYAPWRHSSYGGYVAGAIPSKDQYFDVIRELYPWKTLVVQDLKKGNIPLWNPYNFSGAPLLANFQSQVFYPLTLIYFILPQISAWTVMVISQPILGSIFMYLFATEIGLTSGAALFAAFLFNFSSFANIWMEFTTVWHTILWLPLLLYFVERSVKQKKLTLWQQLLFMFALFSSITGGHPQDFINTFLFFIIYMVVRIFTIKGLTNKEKMLFVLNPFSIIITIPFCLASPQLLPTIELFKNSARVTHDYVFIINNLIVQLWQLPLLFVQDFYGNPATKSNIFGDYILKTLSIGVTGFIFVITTLFTRKRTWHKTFFVVGTLLILLLTVRNPISELFYHYPIPLLSTGTPTRVLFVLMLSLSILAGIGFDEVLQLKKYIPSKALLLVWFIFGILWFIVLKHPGVAGVVLSPTAISTMKRAMIFSTALAGFVSIVISASFYRKNILYIVIVICIGELFYSFTKFNSSVPPLFVFPQNNLMSFLKSQPGINRYWGYGTGQIEANFASQEHLFSPDGTDPLNLGWYNKFIQSSTDGHIANSFTRTTRSDAKILPGYGETELPSNEYRLRVMDALGVKFILDRVENPKDNRTFPENRYKIIWRQDDWIVLENLLAAPRIFLTSDVRGYSGEDDFEKQFFAPSFNPGKTVLLQSADFKNLPVLHESSGSASLVSYTPERIDMQVWSDSQKFLYMSDTYDTGWVVLVDDKQTRVYKTNYAFRGIIVPRGQSKISFLYRPKSFTAGVAVGLIGIISLIIYTIFLKRKSTDKEPPTR